MTRGAILWTVAGGIAAIVISALVTMPWRLAYNPSPSAPRGWYLVTPAQRLRVGEYVLAELPPAVAALADERRYLPRGVPVLKRVAAVGGQTVCIIDGVVTIDGTPIARTLIRDGAGRPLAAWPGCRRLRTDEFFPLNTANPASFDGRYFGPLSTAAIAGAVHPLWISEEPHR